MFFRVSGALISSAMKGWPLVDFPELAQPHAIGRLRRELHVLDDAVPADQLVVGADGMPGELLGSGERRLRPERRGSEEDHCGQGRRQR